MRTSACPAAGIGQHRHAIRRTPSRFTCGFEPRRSHQRKRNTCGCSSAARAADSKPAGRGFESLQSCQSPITSPGHAPVAQWTRAGVFETPSRAGSSPARRTWSAHIDAGSLRPYRCNNKAYLRAAAATLELSEERARQILLDSEHQGQRWEDLSSELAIDDLDANEIHAPGSLSSANTRPGAGCGGYWKACGLRNWWCQPVVAARCRQPA